MGEIFNNRLLLKNNRILFSGNFSGRDLALMEGYKFVIGGSPVPSLVNTLPP